MLKKDLGLFLLIVVVGAVVAFLNPRFISPINLANTANLVGLFGLFSIGEGFVIITGGIDLSIGSQFALFGVVFVDLLVNYHVPWILAVLIIIGFGVILGWVHGFLVTRMNLQPFVVTLCGLLIYRGVARWYTDDGTAGFEFGQSFPALEWITTGRTYGIPHTFVIFLIVAAIMGVLLHRSVFGRYLFAIGKNEEAARFSGIATKKIIVAAYVICGALAGVSSIFLTMYTRSISPASHGNFYELYGIAAAVLGGCSLRGGEGSILGIVLGAILLQVLQNLVNLLGIPSSLNFAVMGTVILIGVLADQQLVRLRQGRADRAKDNLRAAAPAREVAGAGPGREGAGRLRKALKAPVKPRTRQKSHAGAEAGRLASAGLHPQLGQIRGGAVMLEGATIFALVVVAFVVITALMGVRQVPQGYNYTVERFGRYHKTLTPGLGLIVPYIDSVGRKLNVMEQVMDVPSRRSSPRTMRR